MSARSSQLLADPAQSQPTTEEGPLRRAYVQPSRNSALERFARQAERQPQWRNQAWASPGVMASRASGKAVLRASMLRGVAARSAPLSLDQQGSIGFRSGE